ncbi:hypothetical protein GWI33_016363 [Rhynchophorus ferrugineus]|uniref:Major facilitator superfamily (MFS) profile domain-containing protein n=1 Tax=Rhynchophorus ferrugineus TaxID=354439 RepID=A0A834HY58_RHYFE|nr:hypothetical protein GWI33_016363 [Rhynchophorus ferrugineus]
MGLTRTFSIYFYAISVNFLSYGGGLGYGWSSPALPKLSSISEKDHNPLPRPATPSEQSLIASLLSLGAVCSPFLSEIASDKLGRKTTLLLFSLPMIGGYIILIFADTVFQFYVARFLIGITEGCIFSIIPVYSAEISEDHNRGTIGAMMLLFVAIGHFTSSTVGPNVTIRTFSIVSLIPCVIFFIIFGLFSPESPYFYVLKNKNDEAEECLMKLRRKRNVDDEMKEIVKSVTEIKAGVEKSSIKSLFTEISCIKTFVLALLLMLFQQFTGLIYIIDYTQKIFDTANTPLSGDKSVMIVMTVQVLAILISTNIIDKINRRFLLLLSFTVICLLHVILGLFFYLVDHQYHLDGISWLPIVCLMLFIVAFQSGIGPISYIFPTEILEPNVKSVGNMLVICIGLVAEFLIATFLPEMAGEIGFYMPFWVFAAVTFVAVGFVYFFIPETRGKSFLEIQKDVRAKII